MQKKLLTVSVVAAFAALALAGCGKEEPKPAPKAEAPAAPAAPPPPPQIVVKIGHVAPLTGNIAHLGKDNENGARLAVDDLNAMGIAVDGKKLVFELVGEDDQADPKTGTVVAQKLVDAKVNAVVGHLNSGTTIPASKIYNDAGIAQISPSATNPTYTQQGFKTAFRVMANDVQQGSVLGSYAAKSLNAKTVAIIDDRTAYGQGLADEVEKAAKAGGAAVVAREFTKNDATDFTAILTKIKGKKPDVIFYGGMDAQAGPMLKQIKTLGIKTKFLTGDGGCSPEMIKLAGDASEGVYCSQAGLPLDKMPRGADFEKRYKAKFNTDVQIYSPYSYDAVLVIADAIKRANSADPAKIVAELPNTATEGVTGKVQFDDKGDVKNGAITVYTVKGGKLDVLEVQGGSLVAKAEAAVKDAVKDAKEAAKEAAGDAAKAVGQAATAVGQEAKKVEEAVKK
ncbi:MAG: branched-chain amino acid ABC transporter substrate-binding protein [Burkholderiales bacterium]|jgi:branched-chain amino acid transport system substrate-binding protein|nr:branched-chain amino acid ABC transporter substrate-binding protein [Burkholderiales bacterium]